MLEKIKDKNIWTIYGAILTLALGYGISLALLALQMEALGVSKTDMGSLASWFALGIVVFSIPMGKLIELTSAKTMLVVALGGYAASVALFPSLRSFPAIAADRFADGACSVGIWVSCETILLTRAPRGLKAYITTLYAMAVAIGYVLGALAARAIIQVAPMRDAFITSGVLAMLAALFVAFRLDRDDPSALPHGGEASEGDTGAGAPTPATGTMSLLNKVKTSCFGTFAYGYFQASVVLFLPLYLIEQKGVDAKATTLIPAFFALGMLLFSNLAGKVGDRHGHLLVMRVLAVIGTVMILGFVFLSSFTLMIVAVFIAGATLAAISPVSLALQGVVTAPIDYGRSNAIYNAFYAAGMLLGPKVSSILFDRYGGAMMLYHLAALWGAFIVFAIVFARDDPRAVSGPTRAPVAEGA